MGGCAITVWWLEPRKMRFERWSRATAWRTLHAISGPGFFPRAEPEKGLVFRWSILWCSQGTGVRNGKGKTGKEGKSIWGYVWSWPPLKATGPWSHKDQSCLPENWKRGCLSTSSWPSLDKSCCPGGDNSLVLPVSHTQGSWAGSQLSHTTTLLEKAWDRSEGWTAEEGWGRVTLAYS